MDKDLNNKAPEANEDKCEAAESEVNPAADEVKDEKDGNKNQTSEEKHEEEIDSLKKELADVKDKMMRSLAEYDNFRKRSAKERENAYKFSKANVLTKLLPVIDNFERAAENETASFEDYKKGIAMIHNQFNEILGNLGVETFGEKGETFDPNIHTAVMHTEDDAYGESEITDVFSKGYKLGDQVLRPAAVKVAN